MPKLTDHALKEELPPWGVLVLESHHSPEFTMEWREHAFVKLVYVLRGRGVIEMDHRAVHFAEGDLLLVPPRTVNRITDAPDAASSLYVCCVDTRLLAFDANWQEKISGGSVPVDPHFSNRIASHLRKMRHQQASHSPTRQVSIVAAALRIIEWVMQLQDPALELRAKKRQGRGKDDRELMEDYVRRLSTEFYEATTIDDAAESIGMSRRTFTKLFQQVTGSTWLVHVRKLAIHHAKHQLAQTNLSIASVAFECGFNDLSTFYRQFKSHVGQSPKNYRDSITRGGR